MKPSDRFSFGATPPFVPDSISLSLCYYPIIGGDAFALYHYLFSLSTKGQGGYPFTRILNHLDMGMARFEKSLDILTAMSLLTIYHQQEEYLYCLHAPLTIQQFTTKPLYKNLLAKKIGEGAVEELIPKKAQSDNNISKPFSDVFTSEGHLSPISQQQEFDWSAFKAMMTKDKLRFVDEKNDIVAIYHLAEQFGWNWLETYRRVKETAVGQLISTKRLAKTTEQITISNTDLTMKEQAIVREAKAFDNLTFFALLKEQRKASVTLSERQLLQEMAQMGLLDEVLNILLVYVFSKVDSANLNEKYAQKVANDFVYKNITTAEAAILYLRTTKSSQIQKRERSSGTNVPEWSKEEIKTEMSAEDRVKMDALRKQMLAKESMGDDQ